ncbi:MAG: acyl-ACP--UDP-N-acetylglucosamine O-acyltransferase [Spartobacteria bacterium]|nr:acyl-ACP--UDP-N-acetylglucosamine O-acyltransferase [Spartobacteria bacterium]
MSNATIHPTATVSAQAQIGAGVVIGPYAVVDDHAQIGADTKIGPHAVIYNYTTLGERCDVHAGAVIGDAPQDLEFEGRESYVKIGTDCIIREGVTIHRGTKPGTATTVGDGCFLMAFSHLAHNVILGDRVILANAVLLAGYVEVGAGAFISGNAVVHQFCHIGRLAMIGGLSGIGKDIPPFCTTVSACRNRIAGLNAIGLRRAGITPAERADIKKAFNLLYRADLAPKEAAARIRAEISAGPALEMADFIDLSKRGICPYSARDDKD